MVFYQIFSKKILKFIIIIYNNYFTITGAFVIIDQENN